MTKITNDGLTRSGAGCFINNSCTRMATVGVKELNSVSVEQFTFCDQISRCFKACYSYINVSLSARRSELLVLRRPCSFGCFCLLHYFKVSNKLDYII